MTTAAPRWVAKLTLTRFRSHLDLVARFDARPVVLVGANGIGKTNLLEALSLLAPGRGLRGAALSQMQAQGTTHGWAATAEIGGAEVTIGVGVMPEAPERRQVRIGGSPAGAIDLLEHLSLLWLTPDQDRLFTDPASARRRFFDRLVLALYPDHAGHVSRYEAALRERNRLLAADEQPDAAWLTALEAEAAGHGVAIAAARAHGLAELQAMIARLPASPFPTAVLALQGDIEARIDTTPALVMEEELRSEWARRRALDAAAGRATFGPHRADLLVTHAPKGQPAALCSTGEQKALLIGLIVAQAQLVAQVTGRRPLILLDEVAAHLDGDRRGALFDILLDLGVQAWMTGTDLTLFQALADKAQIWTIDQGDLLPITN